MSTPKVIAADTQTTKYIEHLHGQITTLTDQLGALRLQNANLFTEIQKHFAEHGSMTRQDYTAIYLRIVKGISV